MENTVFILVFKINIVFAILVQYIKSQGAKNPDGVVNEVRSVKTMPEI